MKFENKVAIITGSTRGIGRATAELFAKEGAKVIVVGTKEELGESCVNEIKAAGGEAIFCKTDVTSDESLDNLVKTALDAYGKIDILVNNAGVGGTTANMDQITMDEWNTVLATNLTAPFVLCKKLIPIMEKQGAGTIVNVASMAATAAGRGGLAYTSAKHGLLGLTRQMSLDHGRTGVRINAVLPGPIAMGQEIYHAMFDYTGDSLLVSIDKEKLWQCIELLCKIRKIEWKTPPSKNGLNYFPFPIYPEGIWQVFNLMKPDRDYGKHMEQQPRNIVPSEMSVEQINTRLTLIQRSERFGDGNVAAEIENGNLLKMLLRLDDLLNKSVKN